ncbi:GMC family oxidoreductase [Rhizobium sp. S152]|uniref:FAD-dependent oxidoreductase n=1 Tax=Rhizobium sp. S152 TaxID=3055038 RepID=UPI0025A978AD|nr:GMC family oxidoreductase [Rhizobium sp. S152]MDM9629785.1 GMC family oxidoreductase [Rhizobium sp. S152]
MRDPSAEEWDVAIVGAGMGGAALAYSLATSGQKVLVIEKGWARVDTDGAGADSLDPDARMRAGRWPDQIEATIDSVDSSFFAALGCGAGGSTLLYAGALERLQRDDFMSGPEQQRVAPSWPISYDDLAPFYRLAEERLGARGGGDPLQSDPTDLPDPPPLSPGDQHFFGSLHKNGMHPYQLHNAGDRERGGKIDAMTAFLEPATALGDVHLLPNCAVKRIEATREGVTGLLCETENGEFEVKAMVYVMAAGALSTPVLMLNSTSADWPDGIANSSGLVGRNLMFHVSDMMAVWPRGRVRVSSTAKSIAFRDFYWHEGEKFGQIQSTGLTAGRGNIVYFLKQKLDRSGIRWPRFLRQLTHIPGLIGAWVFGRAVVFASILEDYPYWENRVLPGTATPAAIRIVYTAHDELKRRTAWFRRLYRTAFAGHWVFILHSGVNLNFGHACGTCRFGDDPESSVLDRNNRTHDLQNLFVVDGSFFPSSGGVNPSLTIAANALRVGQYIAKILSGDREVMSTASTDTA